MITDIEGAKDELKRLREALNSSKDERARLSKTLAEAEDQLTTVRRAAAAPAAGFSAIGQYNPDEIEPYTTAHAKLEMAILIPEIRAALGTLETKATRLEQLTRIRSGGHSSSKAHHSDEPFMSLTPAALLMEYERLVSLVAELRTTRAQRNDTAKRNSQELTARIAQLRHEVNTSEEEYFQLQRALSGLEFQLITDDHRHEIVRREHLALRNKIGAEFANGRGWQMEAFKSALSPGAELLQRSRVVTSLDQWIYSKNISWQTPTELSSLLEEAYLRRLANGWNTTDIWGKEFTSQSHQRSNTSREEARSLSKAFTDKNGDIPFEIFVSLTELLIERYE